MQSPEGLDGGVVRFGAFEADLRSGELSRNARRIALQHKPFQLLALLLARPGELVTRDELRARLWPEDVYVDFEQGLNKAVNKLRQALGDSAEKPRYVETVARRGYRFVAVVDRPSGRPSGEPAPGESPRGRGTLRVALALVAVGMAAASVTLLSDVRPAPPSRVTLAVLPFDDLSPDLEQEYLSDGLTEEMIAELGRVRPKGLAVIGRASVMRYKATLKRADEIGRELGAEYLLSGSVRRAGDRVRITAALLRARDGVQLWSSSYERGLDDVLALQSDAARAIAAQLPLRSSAADAGPPARPTVKPDAYEAYLRGRHLWSRFTASAERKAIRYFEQVVEQDPTFAPAHAWLGSSYLILAAIEAMPPSEARVQARPYLVRALELDPASDVAHCQMGWFQLLYEWDFAAAEREFRNALELNPSLTNARHGLASFLAAMGRMDESLVELRRAQAGDPLSLLVNADLPLFLYWAGQYEAAIAEGQKALELEPRFPPTHFSLRHVYEIAGMHEEAVASAIESSILADGERPWTPKLRAAFAQSGWNGYLRQQRERLLEQRARGSLQAYWLARVSLLLGENEAALRWLDEAYQERPYKLVFVGVDPLFEPLRSEARFSSLLRRIGLPRPSR